MVFYFLLYSTLFACHTHARKALRLRVMANGKGGQGLGKGGSTDLHVAHFLFKTKEMVHIFCPSSSPYQASATWRVIRTCERDPSTVRG